VPNVALRGSEEWKFSLIHVTLPPVKLGNSFQKGGSGEKAFIVLGLDYSLLSFKAIMALLN